MIIILFFKYLFSRYKYNYFLQKSLYCFVNKIATQ